MNDGYNEFEHYSIDEENSEDLDDFELPQENGQLLDDYKEFGTSVVERNEEDAIDTVPFYRSTIDPAFDPFNLYDFDMVTRGQKFVSDEIGEDYKKWYKEIPTPPIFITAQTGKGKNTFIEEKLLDHLKKEINYVKETILGRIETPYKVLILSNRIALNIQMKARIIEKLELSHTIKSKEPKGSKRYNKDMDKQHDFGFITILSYHSLRGKIRYYTSLEYTHVVFDECHFFTSDAQFNSQTGVILKAITTRFKNAVRIYMSATMNDCLRYICDYELRAIGWQGENRKKFMEETSTKFRRYSLENDYSYLNVKYFYDYNLLASTIKESSNKWLVFIDDKNRGKEFKHNDLKEISDSVMIVDSGSKTDKEFIEMLKKERLPEEKKVLISTSVIDNGVSFHDSTLTNVVVEEIDRVKCMQLVGRIRPEKGDKVNLYIKVATTADVQKKMQSLRLLKNAYEIYDDTFIWGGDEVFKRYRFYHLYYDKTERVVGDATQWFYRTIDEPEKVYPNAITYDFVKILSMRYDSILQEMKESGSGWKYLEYQFSWFDKRFVKEEDPPVQEFINFLKSLPSSIQKAKREEFAREFENLYNKAYKPQSKLSDKAFGMKNINDILRNLKTGLALEMSPDKRTWLVIGQFKANDDD